MEISSHLGLGGPRVHPRAQQGAPPCRWDKRRQARCPLNAFLAMPRAFHVDAMRAWHPHQPPSAPCTRGALRAAVIHEPQQPACGHAAAPVTHQRQKSSPICSQHPIDTAGWRCNSPEGIWVPVDGAQGWHTLAASESKPRSDCREQCLSRGKGPSLSLSLCFALSHAGTWQIWGDMGDWSGDGRLQGGNPCIMKKGGGIKGGF